MTTFHFTYKTTSPSGKYYIGRHSTKVINDGYLGSGKWVKSIKDQEKLARETIAFYETFDDLKWAESILLTEHVGQPDCMNFNNQPSGFASGLLNPAHAPEEKKRRSEHNWAKTPEGRAFHSEHNPSKRPEVKVMRRESALSNDAFTSRWDMGDDHHMKSDEHRQRMRDDNPAKSEEARAKISVSSKALVASGVIRGFGDPEIKAKATATMRAKFASGELFFSQDHKDKLSVSALKRERLECPHCGKVCSKPLAIKYHFDKCKTLREHK